ncbi:hypothetical protein SAMN05660748_1643 [Blastococcus aggregatus]|uniref:Dolichyl-phosphate-mannose-protein mannosyltransferase n=1 Tax=Blastococcus aggregatus TaxID=38502 RepID=A0A285V4E0_9ACTN|nr:hypothetical protein [Blastococcus aggregatus]SOC48930.1 hypothetical protein SAMN05660748_1643 [Blastococcus aggregatus]
MRRSRHGFWALLVAAVAVAAAFGVTVARVLGDVDDSFRFGGDQALTGLSVHEASSFDRDLGPYSRYGWSHPGPLWFYLLAPPMRLLGGDDIALMAAGVLINGLLAVAVVLAVHRAGRPLLTLGVSAVLLAFVLRMPAEMFVDVWSPYALLMGTLLFLVLAARVHSGSWPALLGMLLAGSFLAQTHVGTAPLVALVSATGGVSFVLARRARRATTEPGTDAGEPPRARPGRWTVVLGVLLVAVWIPPVVEQLSSPVREGNLVRLVSFFLNHEDPGGSPTPPQALIAVGRILAMTPYDWGPGPWEMDVSTLPAPVGLALAAQALAAVTLVLLGRRWGSRAGTWWGAVLCAALAAAVVSAVTVTGVLYWYLIVWVAVLPAATAIGALHLVLDRVAAGRAGAPGPRLALDRAPVLLPLAVVVVAGSVVAAMSLGDAAEELPSDYGVVEASRLVDDALGDVDTSTVHVDIETPALWPVAAGVVNELVADGLDVTVDRGSEELFGADRVSAGDEPVDLVFVTTGSRAHDRLLREAGVTDVGTAPTEWGPTSVLLRVSR